MTLQYQVFVEPVPHDGSRDRSFVCVMTIFHVAVILVVVDMCFYQGCILRKIHRL